MIVSAKGADIHYETRGRGPVLIIPSAVGTRPYERQTPPPLDDHFQLVFVDMRGNARSTGDPKDLTFDVVAEDLEAVRASLGAPRVMVLGHSILGSLAVEYSRRCPESVSHVIISGTPPRGDMNALAAKAATFFEETASEDRKQVLRDNLAKLPPDAPPPLAMLAQTPTRFFDAHLDVAPLFAESEVNPAFFMHLLGTLAPAWDITRDPGSLRAPLLIAHGRHDYAVPHTMWDGVVSTLPDATLHLFERSGHQPFYEEPDAFVAAVTSWMSRPR